MICGQLISHLKNKIFPGSLTKTNIKSILKTQTKTVKKIELLFAIGLFIQVLFFPWSARAEATLIAPTILKPDTEMITTAKPLFAGVSLNDTVVEFNLDGELVGSAQTTNHPSGVGNFYWQPTVPLGLGTHSLQVRAVQEGTDAVSDYTAEMVFTIVPFGGPTLLMPDELVLTRAFTYIKGVAHNDSVIRVFVDGESVEQFSIGADDSGAVGFIHSLENPIISGTHAVYLQAEDQTGRASLPSVVKTVQIVDFPGPTLLVPTDGQVIVEQNPMIGGVAVNDSLIKIYADGELDGEFKVNNDQSGVANFAYRLQVGLERGQEHLITAQAWDSKGRVSVVSNQIAVLLKDPYIPPTLVSVAGAADRPTVAGVAHNDSVVQIYVNDALDQEFTPENDESGTLYFETQLSQALTAGGTYKISAMAFDPNGKPSLRSNVVDYTFIEPAGTGGPVAAAAPDEPEPSGPIAGEIGAIEPELEAEIGDITVKEGETGEIGVTDEEIPGTVETPDGEAGKVIAGEETGAEATVETAANWPLILGLIILIGLAVIFIIWYLGQKRRLLNEGIDKLFSDEEADFADQSQPSLLDSDADLIVPGAEPEPKDQAEPKIKPKPRKKNGKDESVDDIPSPPPSI